MSSFIANSWFLYFAVPLVSVFLGVYLKFVTRNDAHASFKKEDLSIGLELSITALIIFITGSVNLAKRAQTEMEPTARALIDEKLISIPWLLLAFVLLIWGMSTVVRKLGWRNETELNWFTGIILPGLFGIAALILVVSWIG